METNSNEIPMAPFYTPPSDGKQIKFTTKKIISLKCLAVFFNFRNIGKKFSTFRSSNIGHQNYIMSRYFFNTTYTIISFSINRVLKRPLKTYHLISSAVCVDKYTTCPVIRHCVPLIFFPKPYYPPPYDMINKK